MKKVNVKSYQKLYHDPKFRELTSPEKFNKYYVIVIQEKGYLGTLISDAKIRVFDAVKEAKKWYRAYKKRYGEDVEIVIVYALNKDHAKKKYLEGYY